MDFQRLESAIREQSHADVVEMVEREFLSPIADGESSVRAVRHPLGFACFPVHRVSNLGACVHVWPRRRRVPKATTSPFHCHSWDLLSHVLSGQVGNQLVDVSDGHTYKEFTVYGDGPVDHMVATGRTVDLRGLEPEFWSAGQTYSLPAGWFHASTMVEDTAAVTMVLGHHRRRRPDITLGSLDTPNHTVTRKLYDAAQSARLARTTMNRVRQAGGHARASRQLVGAGV